MTRLLLPCTPSCWQMATSSWLPARLQTKQAKVWLPADLLFGTRQTSCTTWSASTFCAANRGICTSKSSVLSECAAPPDEAPEVVMDGWNTELPDSYAFLYADDTGDGHL